MKKVVVIDADAFDGATASKQEDMERHLKAEGYLVMFVKPGSRVIVHDLADLKPRPPTKRTARRRR